MATFSPSPAPRRSTRTKVRGASPARRVFSSRGPQTPVPFNNADTMSVLSAMDIDERSSVVTERSFSRISGDMTFSKTDEMTASFYANLPLEVRQVLKTSDFTKDLYTGAIDTETGFALIASVRTCFVWQHAQATKGIPTCYVFACPEDVKLPRPPFHSLIPRGTREPGLILLSSSGQIRFWDNIGIGLAGGDNYVISQLDDFEYDEEVTNFIRADAQTYILSTSYGGLYRLLLTSTGGKYHLTARPFSKPSSGGSFSRLFPSFLSSSPPAAYTKDKSKHIHAVSLIPQSNPGDKELYVLANGEIQHWCMKPEGWEAFIGNQNLVELLAPVIQTTFRVRTDDLELSDLAASSDGNITLLISYSGEELFQGFRRLYALVEISPSPSGFTVESVKTVPYQTTTKPGAPVHPRVQFLFDASIVSVQFGDAVAICARNTDYRDRLELKSIADRTLGVGVNSSTNQLLILAANSMIKLDLDLEKIEAFSPETGRTDLIKSIMIQAILYGSIPMNPLRFGFPPDPNEEALMRGADQLSEAVLKSEPDIVRQNADLTTQMTGRKERLSWLIGFINENGVLGRMSQKSRQKLATDAEKLYACHQLWLSYNKHLGASSTQSVLKEAIRAYMEEMQDLDHEDLIRAFFRYHVGDIGALLKKVIDVVKSPSHTGNAAALLPEANRILITVLASSFQYRAFNSAVYGIDAPMVKAWTSRPSVIDSVLALFDLTTNVVERDNQLKSSTGKEPSSQLTELAAVYLESMRERLEWLASLDAPSELEQLQQRFSQLRPEILETLRKNGHKVVAFDLAEKYQDFSTLVALCHRETIFPPESNPNYGRIQGYIQRYKEDFAKELFQWYIQHGEIRTLFEQEDSLGAYIDHFFKENPHPGISWIQDLYRGQYTPAATTLLQTAEQASNLEAKHLMLSIGKLACLAHAQETNALLDEGVLDAFHDDLDFISIHEGLLEDLRTALVSQRARQSLDTQVEMIFNTKASYCSSRTGFSHIFKDLTRQLLQGKAVSVEDMVDLLTLKDNTSTIDDYATAIHLLYRNQTLPQARKDAATRTAWRRVYLHDNWVELKKTVDLSDDELNRRYQDTALFATLCSVLRRAEDIIPPDVALLIPSNEDIISRWPGLSAEQVATLAKDYVEEQDELGELNLEEIFNRIQDLSSQALNNEWEEEQ